MSSIGEIKDFSFSLSSPLYKICAGMLHGMLSEEVVFPQLCSLLANGNTSTEVSDSEFLLLYFVLFHLACSQQN